MYKGHKNHELILYEEKLIDIKELRNTIDILNIVINKFKMNLEEIINKFKKLQDNFDTYYNINNNIITNYEIHKNRNYNFLMGLKNINDDIDNEIDKLKYECNYCYNLNNLLYLYNEINDDNLEIEIKYKSININEKEKLRIFGNKFINNNVKKCKLINKKKYMIYVNILMILIKIMIITI